LIFSAHLIDDGDEIRERFVAHGRIWPMWSKSWESAIEPAVMALSMTPTRDGLRPAGHGGFSRREVAFVDKAVGVGDGSSEVRKTHGRRESRVGREPAGGIRCDKGAADTLWTRVNKVIDLRTDIVVHLADATQTHGWNASRDGGCTCTARLRGPARRSAL
jgi:hypothetical protein